MRSDLKSRVQRYSVQRAYHLGRRKSQEIGSAAICPYPFWISNGLISNLREQPCAFDLGAWLWYLSTLR